MNTQTKWQTTIFCHTTTPGNTRRHWAVEAKKAKLQRMVACSTIHVQSQRLGDMFPSFPVRVTLTRISPRKMDRHNLPGAMKHIIDGIADAYGVDDGDERWQFEFKQEIGKQHAVRIEIESV